MAVDTPRETPAAAPASRTLRPFEALHEAAWLHLNGRTESAEEIFRAIRSGPAGRLARRELELLLRSQHRWEESLEICRELAALDPGASEVQLFLALRLLALGRYAEAWPLYDHRRRTPAAGPRPKLPMPEWQGDTVTSLLVLDEQGFGDTLQFARYLPLLRGRGIRVVLLCREPISPLLAPLVDDLVLTGSDQPVPRCDAWVSIGSLPWRFGATAENLPAEPYIRAPEDRRAAWANLPAAARIGVVTRGKPTHVNDANRSMPHVAAMVAHSLPGAVSLESETSPLGLKDFADTAAVMERLDLIVSVDTGAAHLAGALGKPCWLLLPHLPDWRWMHDRADSPWYPSIRIYRQPAPGDWTSVLRLVRRDVRALFGEG